MTRWEIDFDKLVHAARLGGTLCDMCDDDIDEVLYLRNLGMTPEEVANVLFGVEDKPRNKEAV